ACAEENARSEIRRTLMGSDGIIFYGSMRRILLSLASLCLLILAAIRIPPAPGQGAVPLSKPGQEDLTFWANHNGLEQLDVEGEVGFGDMARILLRRRSNSE